MNAQGITDLTRLAGAISRRRFLVGGATLAGLLAACGSDEPDAAPPTTGVTSTQPETSAPDTATPDPSAGTRSVQASQGMVDVPVEPQRIVATDYVTSLALLDLGAAPIGVTQAAKDATQIPAAYVDALADIPAVDTAPGEFNYEVVADLDPDLNVGWVVMPENVEPFSEIAPTAAYEWADWPILVGQVADAVNRTSEYDALAAALDARCASFADTHADALAANRVNFVIADGVEGSLFSQQRGSLIGSLALKAGITLADASNGDGYWGDISFEQLDTLDDADVILYAEGIDGAVWGNTQALMDSPLWPTLGAVQADRAFAFRNNSVCSYRWAMDALDELDAIFARL